MPCPTATRESTRRPSTPCYAFVCGARARPISMHTSRSSSASSTAAAQPPRKRSGSSGTRRKLRFRPWSGRSKVATPNCVPRLCSRSSGSARSRRPFRRSRRRRARVTSRVVARRPRGWNRMRAAESRCGNPSCCSRMRRFSGTGSRATRNSTACVPTQRCRPPAAKPCGRRVTSTCWVVVPRCARACSSNSSATRSPGRKRRSRARLTPSAQSRSALTRSTTC